MQDVYYKVNVAFNSSGLLEVCLISPDAGTMHELNSRVILHAHSGTYHGCWLGKSSEAESDPNLILQLFVPFLDSSK